MARHDTEQKLPLLNNGVAQMAIIVEDLEKAVESYWKLLGIGPWHFYTDGKPLVERMTYHGERAEFSIWTSRRRPAPRLS